MNPPTNYRRLLGTIPEGVTFSDRLKPDSSFVHVFIQERSEFGAATVRLPWENRGHRNSLGLLAKKSRLRVRTECHRRRSSRCRPAATGFVDVKVCAIDETWSGLKLMVRRSNRKLPAKKFKHS